MQSFVNGHSLVIYTDSKRSSFWVVALAWLEVVGMLVWASAGLAIAQLWGPGAVTPWLIVNSVIMALRLQYQSSINPVFMSDLLSDPNTMTAAKRFLPTFQEPTRLMRVLLNIAIWTMASLTFIVALATVVGWLAWGGMTVPIFGMVIGLAISTYLMMVTFEPFKSKKDQECQAQAMPELESIDQDIRSISDQIEALKKSRALLIQARPPEPIEDADFLADAFGDKSELLLIHNMGKNCNYCTLWADGLNGIARQLQERCAVVIASPDPEETQQAFARERGWSLPMLSYSQETAEKMGFYVEGQGYWPGVSALHKDADGKIWRTGKDFFGPGDDYMPVWPLFDLLNDGSKGWEPS